MNYEDNSDDEDGGSCRYSIASPAPPHISNAEASRELIKFTCDNYDGPEGLLHYKWINVLAGNNNNFDYMKELVSGANQALPKIDHMTLAQFNAGLNPSDKEYQSARLRRRLRRDPLYLPPSLANLPMAHRARLYISLTASSDASVATQSTHGTTASLMRRLNDLDLDDGVGQYGYGYGYGNFNNVSSGMNLAAGHGSAMPAYNPAPVVNPGLQQNADGHVNPAFNVNHQHPIGGGGGQFNFGTTVHQNQNRGGHANHRPPNNGANSGGVYGGHGNPASNNFNRSANSGVSHRRQGGGGNAYLQSFNNGANTPLASGTAPLQQRPQAYDEHFFPGAVPIQQQRSNGSRPGDSISEPDFATSMPGTSSRSGNGNSGATPADAHSFRSGYTSSAPSAAFSNNNPVDARVPKRPRTSVDQRPFAPATLNSTVEDSADISQYSFMKARTTSDLLDAKLEGRTLTIGERIHSMNEEETCAYSNALLVNSTGTVMLRKSFSMLDTFKGTKESVETDTRRLRGEHDNAVLVLEAEKKRKNDSLNGLKDKRARALALIERQYDEAKAELNVSIEACDSQLRVVHGKGALITGLEEKVMGAINRYEAFGLVVANCGQDSSNPEYALMADAVHKHLRPDDAAKNCLPGIVNADHEKKNAAKISDKLGYVVTVGAQENASQVTPNTLGYTGVVGASEQHMDAWAFAAGRATATVHGEQEAGREGTWDVGGDDSKPAAAKPTNAGKTDGASTASSVSTVPTKETGDTAFFDGASAMSTNSGDSNNVTTISSRRPGGRPNLPSVPEGAPVATATPSPPTAGFSFGGSTATAVPAASRTNGPASSGAGGTNAAAASTPPFAFGSNATPSLFRFAFGNDIQLGSTNPHAPKDTTNAVPDYINGPGMRKGDDVETVTSGDSSKDSYKSTK